VTTWAEVAIGDVLQDKKGRVFTVDGITGDKTYVLKDDDGKVYPIRQPRGEVIRLLSRDAAMEQAIALMQVHFRGTVHTVVEREGDEPYRCPVEFVHAGDLAAHIYLMHSITTEKENFAEMVKQHVDLHHPDRKLHGWIDHVHDPQFAQYLRRMARP
jgi:hypothetical protein